jgi:transcriptional regulator with XRE-family HTH domain
MPHSAARDIQFQKSIVPEGRGVHRFVKFIWRRINRDEWSQEDVAAQSGVSSSTMRKWRRGDRNPRLSELEAVINTLGYELVLKEME